MGMQIWPAIDLRGKRCVRLQQGDYGRETVFGDDPAEMAAQWVSHGAHRLHVVDLDGARTGKQENLDCVKAIVAAAKVPVQLGGGVRDEAAVETILALGVERVVVGTRAIKDPEWFRRVCRRFPKRVVLGIDARDGLVATEGWQETSKVTAADVARMFADEPLAAIVFTDIATDGMLAGPNLSAMKAMQEASPHPVIASGGVTTVDDVARLSAVPMAGAIIGRALYEGRIQLYDALVAADDAPPPLRPSVSRDF